MNKEEEKKIPRLIKWSLGLKPGPIRIDLILTNKCNQKCGYCYLREHENHTGNELTTEEITKLVREASKLGIYNWNLMGGGEPMFDQERALTTMREIKKLGMFGNITTNGTLFDKNSVEELIRIEWDCVNFSIDSAEAGVQDQLRGQKGAFRKAGEALELFKQIKRRLKKEKPTIVIHSVITKNNYNKIKELIQFAREKGAEKLEFTQVMSFSRDARRLRLNSKEATVFKRSIPELLSYSKVLCLKTNLIEYKEGDLVQSSENMNWLIKKDAESHKIRIRCFNPWTNLMILNNGDVGPCCLYTPDKKIGNIRESSLKEIWFGKKQEEFKNKIKNNELRSCKDCPSTEVIRNRKIREELERNIIFKASNVFKNELG